MKIKRFAGHDMRDAMRQVRRAMGGDAVILETINLDDGIEISAAIDFDPVDYARQKAEETAQLEVSSPAETPVEAPAAPVGTAASDDMARMHDEVQSIRCLLEAQLSRLVWNDTSRRRPRATTIMRNLTQLGLTPDVVNGIVAELGDPEALDNTWTVPLKQLAHSIPISDIDIVEQGGVFAVVGPTGVGKTTTVAKLAAQFALRHDPDKLGLISADGYRIGAREQLETFGNILNTPVHQANDAEQLRRTLYAVRDKKLVLIDTAGMSPRDVRLSQELAKLANCGESVDILLALPANAQTDALQEVVETFKHARPKAAILTKMDESASLGGAISVLMRAKLPLAYVANGQRVPEDLHTARARQTWLVKAALELMNRQQQPADDVMAANFAEVAIDECA